MFNKIFAALAAKGGKPDQLMIDATCLCNSRCDQFCPGRSGTYQVAAGSSGKPRPYRTQFRT